MPFFNTIHEAFTTIAAIAFGISLAEGLILLWREMMHLREVSELRKKIVDLEAICLRQDIELNQMKDILIAHWPAESVRLQVSGNVSNSTLTGAGRDASDTEVKR